MENKHQSYDLAQMQSLPLNAKIKMTERRIRDWYEAFDGEVYVSVSGGKDSQVLAYIVKKLYPDVPCVFVNTGLEYDSVRLKGNELADEILRPEMNFVQVITKYGYPVISKEISLFVHQMQMPQTERNAKQAYKQTIKEARKDSGDVVDEAINTHTKRQVEGSKKNSEVSYSNKDGKYYRQVGTQKPIELTSDQYKMHLNGQDAELAAQLSESADAWSIGDIANWASENQGLALAIAGGTGVAGGALLFGDDD